MNRPGATPFLILLYLLPVHFHEVSGRTSHLEALVHLIESACIGQGQMVLIAGEAGIGKSRLVSETMVRLRSSESRATHAAVLTLQGHCFEQDSTLPYAPLLDMLRTFFASRSREEGTASPVPIAPELVKLLPELATFLPDLAPSSPLEPDQEKRRLYQALLDFSSHAEVGAMIRATFALARAVSADFLETVYTLTEGSPFFIEEVLKSLVTAGEIVYSDGRWEHRPPLGEAQRSHLHLPRSVQLAVQQRLNHVSPIARHLLTLAAVAGRRFDFALLQQLTQQNETELVHLIKELVTAQLVVEESEDMFIFRHALTRQAVYANLLARERRALHRLIAETLERVYTDALDASPGDLTYHFYEAREWSKVLEYAQRAGEKAQALYAPHAAIQQYTHALEAARQLAQPPPISLYRARGQCIEQATACSWQIVTQAGEGGPGGSYVKRTPCTIHGRRSSGSAGLSRSHRYPGESVRIDG